MALDTVFYSDIANNQCHYAECLYAECLGAPYGPYWVNIKLLDKEAIYVTPLKKFIVKFGCLYCND